jgi:uncharacterized repeat protein (TIGR01451 family)
VGEEWTVNISVNNTGDLTAHNVNVSLSVPAGLSIVSGSNPQNLGSIVSASSGNASWTMRVDATGNYAVPVNVSSSSYGENFAGSGSFSVNTSYPTYLPLILKKK